jgi:hypothetical protein
LSSQVARDVLFLSGPQVAISSTKLNAVPPVEPKLTNEQLPSYPALNNPGGWEDPVASIKLGHFR